MAKPVMEFNAVAYSIGDHTGYRPVFTGKQAKTDLDFATEVVKEKGLAVTPFEALHVVQAFGEVGPQKVAEDGCPRGITKLIKWVPVAQGSLESPADAWNDATCKAVIKPQLLADVERTIDATFKNVNEGIKVKLNYVTYLGAKGVQNVIKSLTAFAGYGNHMEFDASLGDTAELLWTEGGVDKSVALNCTGSDVAQATFAFPNEIIALEAGTELTFVMKSRGGVAEGSVYTSKKAVTYLGYTGKMYAYDIRSEGLDANTVEVSNTKDVTIRGVALDTVENIVLTITAKDGTTASVGAFSVLSKTATALTTKITPDCFNDTVLKDHDLKGATGKLMLQNYETSSEELAFKFAE